jgi:hypothetical protein
VSSSPRSSRELATLQSLANHDPSPIKARLPHCFPITMPAVNGTLTPPSSHEIAATTGLGTKRKRAGSESGRQVNGAHDGHQQAADATLQSDILVVLRRFDILPIYAGFFQC